MVESTDSHGDFVASDQSAGSAADTKLTLAVVVMAEPTSSLAMG